MLGARPFLFGFVSFYSIPEWIESCTSSILRFASFFRNKHRKTFFIYVLGWMRKYSFMAYSKSLHEKWLGIAVSFHLKLATQDCKKLPSYWLLEGCGENPGKGTLLNNSNSWCFLVCPNPIVIPKKRTGHGTNHFSNKPRSRWIEKLHPLKTHRSPEKLMVGRWHFRLKWSLFRWHASFQAGSFHHSHRWINGSRPGSERKAVFGRARFHEHSRVRSSLIYNYYSFICTKWQNEIFVNKKIQNSSLVTMNLCTKDLTILPSPLPFSFQPAVFFGAIF